MKKLLICNAEWNVAYVEHGTVNTKVLYLKLSEYVTVKCFYPEAFHIYHMQ